ncbi:hypothetical protein LTR85_011570 [Meristemomyces frigidus]|nr:hypothetical protein LTR85_011570 [Meristemomyces frigidus]
MALSSEQQHELQTQLQQVATACNERCLYFAAKWSAELLNSFSSSDDSTTNDGSDTDIDDDDDDDVPTPVQPTNHDRKEARLEAKELPRFLMAKSFFDCREYDRCAAVFLPSQIPHSTPAPQITALTTINLSLTPHKKPPASKPGLHAPKPQVPTPPKKPSQKSLFLALYARYLSGEKRKNEDSETILGPADGPVTANKEVSGVLAVLEEYFNARGGIQNLGNSQGWLDYLYGIILMKAKSENLAKQWLLRSVNLQPYNWSAWVDLASLLGSPEELQQISEHIPRNIMALFFHTHCSQELYQQTAVVESLSHLQSIFPRSAWLQQQKALLHYHARDHETAALLFDSLLKDHPHRLEGLEIYSNLLYVLPNRPKLATLAAMASNTDKFRPETNCILGNYYSLISEHEKAVLHFRRALTLDRNFQAAWTLMGHEYIELKNTQAAIESYRRAVDINRKDYRAWYGLGQGYEMLECYSYSLFYYQRAAALCPGDPKMWGAVAQAYSRCNKHVNAIQAYKRALVVGSQMDNAASSFGSGAADPLDHAVGGALDPHILYDIATLYEKDSNWDEAAAYMELTLAQEEGAEEGDEGLGVTQVTSRARLWLARYCYGRGEWSRTMELANELCQDGVEVEEAKGLVRDVRARMQLGEVEEEGEMDG